LNSQCHTHMPDLDATVLLVTTSLWMVLGKLIPTPVPNPPHSPFFTPPPHRFSSPPFSSPRVSYFINFLHGTIAGSSTPHYDRQSAQTAKLEGHIAANCEQYVWACISCMLLV
jgi:hypothetical protein